MSLQLHKYEPMTTYIWTTYMYMYMYMYMYVYVGR